MRKQKNKHTENFRGSLSPKPLFPHLLIYLLNYLLIYPPPFFFFRCVAPTECPSGTAAAGGVACRAVPFVCSNGAATDNGQECVCRRSHCTSCQILSQTAEQCTECGRNRYLTTSSTCVSRCPESQTNYGTGSNGRTCRQPFSCVGRRVAGSNESCICSQSSCAHCEWTANNSATVSVSSLKEQMGRG